MKIYMARHGQVLPKECYGSMEFPEGDMPLSEIGREQAVFLGKHLKEKGFSGKIYSSPFVRALETAEIVAEYTNSEIIPWAPFREIVKDGKKMVDFKGLSTDEIKEKFPHISPKAELEYPWWGTSDETGENVKKRVKEGYDKLNITEDTLFVGHGASVSALFNILGNKNVPVKVCNCSLSYYDSENKIKPLVRDDTGFLPYKIRSYNAVMKSDEDKKMVDALINQKSDIIEKLKNVKSTKILHISDTPSYSYPYYEKLISDIKPDIIIHTGDFSDEVKPGRIKEAIPDYEENVKIIGEILSNSGAKKVYAVCGNNDVYEIIKKYMPCAEFIEPSTTVDICGVTCGFAHSIDQVKENAEWYFYGHGLTGETWSFEKNNTAGGYCRFNGVINISVITMPERKLYTIPYPFC